MSNKDPYEVLFKDYTNELGQKMKLVMGWWDQLHQSGAAQDIKARWPMGPCSHPRIIAIFRKYFLAIEEINKSQRENFYKPQEILLDKLQAQEPELFLFMKNFRFMPMGLSPSGENC